MLTYLIEVIQSLLTMSIMIGMIYAYANYICNKIGKRIIIGGTIAGILASVFMSYTKNATSLINTGYWNLGIFGFSLVFFILFIIFSFNFHAKDLEKINSFRKVLTWISLMCLTAVIIFYAMPDIWALPYVFAAGAESIFTTEYIYNFIGYTLGLILAFLIGFSTYQVCVRLPLKYRSKALKIVLFINALRQISVGLQILLAKRILRVRDKSLSHTLFNIAKFTSNNDSVFIYLILIVALIIPIGLWVWSFKQNESWENPAQHRKIRAKWRKSRRWATAIMLFVICAFVNITAVKAWDSREEEISPIEDSVIEGKNVCVKLSQVSDGKLHRFAYTTEGGTQIRFIVIKKTNADAYGVGLDACDICGETGYYEKDGQVVCKLCDVVMNVNTIGFKGGCNPIVIDYSVENGQIVVPIATLLDHEKEFE